MTVAQTFLIDQLVEANVSSVAEEAYMYSSSAAVYAFSAEVTGQIATSSGLMLTVSQPTTLSVAVGRVRGGVIHDVSGCLRDESGVGINGRTVRILIDGVDEQHVRTDADGRFSYPFHFEPGKYDVQAVFEGEAASNASAYGKTNRSLWEGLCLHDQDCFQGRWMLCLRTSLEILCS